MHIFKGPGSALFAPGMLTASGLHFAQPSNGQLSPPREPRPQSDQEPNHAVRAVGPGDRTPPEVRTCVRACARPGTRGMHQRRDALFLPQASQRPAGRVASRSQPPPPGWGSGQTIGPPLVTTLVCVCVYPEGRELGEQGEDPLLGFPRCQAPGCIPTAPQPLRPRTALASSPYRKQAQRGPPAANGVCAWLREAPDGFCHLPAVGLGWRLGRGVGGGRKILLRARFCSSQKACMHTA